MELLQSTLPEHASEMPTMLLEAPLSRPIVADTYPDLQEARARGSHQLDTQAATSSEVSSQEWSHSQRVATSFRQI